VTGGRFFLEEIREQLVARAKIPAERLRGRPLGAAFRVLAGVVMLGFAVVDRAT
jgi:hypothetical protein